MKHSLGHFNLYIIFSLIKAVTNPFHLQGPLRNTCYDFWKMVWEQECSVVVMLNKIIENNMLKCHPYWPSGEIDEDGVSDDEVVLNELKINFVSKEFFDFYTISKLRISNSAVDQSKLILHFHYHAWPDFGVPESPTMFLTFLNAVRQYYKQSKGPPVVHCSAGIGRTGTLILVDVILKLIEEKQTNNIDVFSILLHLRKHRLGLVQTPDQLRFCFLSILQGAEKFRTENFRDTYIRAPMSDMSDSSSGSVEYFYRQGDSDNSEATDDDNSLDDEMDQALPDSIEDETRESSEEDLDLDLAVSPKEVVTGENGMFSEGEEGESSRPVSESHDLDLPTDGIGSVSPIANDFFELPDDIIVSRKSKRDQEKPVPDSEQTMVAEAPMKNRDLQDILSMKEPALEMNDIMLTEDVKPEALSEPVFTSAEPLVDSNLTATEVDGGAESSAGDIPTNDVHAFATGETTKKRLSSSDDNTERKKRKQKTADIVTGMKARLADHELGTESNTYYWESFGKPLLVGSLAAAGLSFIVYLFR